jgi:hypothetical protein
VVANLLWEGASCSLSHENVAKPANFGSCPVFFPSVFG